MVRFQIYFIQTKIKTFIKAKLKKSDDQTNIYKHGKTAHENLQNIISVQNLLQQPINKL